MSETDTCRSVLANFCVGNGVDLGFGGSPINETAICVDRAETDARAHCGASPTHLVGDIANLTWFRDNTLDYVYSSHALEDFQETALVLSEWMRVLKGGGKLVLFLPDQAAYEGHCAAAGTFPNQAHVHKDFSLEFVRKRLFEIGITQHNILFESWPFPGNPYSFAIVVRKP